ncbi:MAG: hypothetical protein JW725_04485 [Candidatus Babeliaceae bacterium]|nr:hypothetical protein [Candidatus Babeliaceae bacterium]
MKKIFFIILIGISGTTVRGMAKINEKRTTLAFLSFEKHLKKMRKGRGFKTACKKLETLKNNLGSPNIEKEIITYAEQAFYYWWQNTSSFKKLLPAWFILFKSDSDAIKKLLHLWLLPKGNFKLSDHILENVYLGNCCKNICKLIETGKITEAETELKKLREEYGKSLPCGAQIWETIQQTWKREELYPGEKKITSDTFIKWVLDEKLIHFARHWFFYLLSTDTKNLKLAHPANDAELSLIINSYLPSKNSTRGELRTFEGMNKELKQYLYERMLGEFINTDTIKEIATKEIDDDSDDDDEDNIFFANSHQSKRHTNQSKKEHAQDQRLMTEIDKLFESNSLTTSEHPFLTDLETLLTAQEFREYKKSFMSSYILNPLIFGGLITLAENQNIPNQKCLQTIIKISGLHLSNDDKLNKMLLEKKLDLHKIFEMCEKTFENIKPKTTCNY